MGYWVDNGIEELKEWEQRLLESLSRLLSPEQISYYLSELERDAPGLYERAQEGEGIFTESVFTGISSLSQIRTLLKELTAPVPDQVPIELAVRFATLSFRAGMSTGMFAPGRATEMLEWALHRSEKDFTAKLQHAGELAISESARKSVESRHAPLREIKDKAAEIAQELWERGSNLRHHDMATYLVENYQDENERFPFTRLPGVREENTTKIMRQVTKEVALKLKRHDLIYNRFGKKGD